MLRRKRPQARILSLLVEGLGTAKFDAPAAQNESSHPTENNDNPSLDVVALWGALGVVVYQQTDGRSEGMRGKGWRMEFDPNSPWVQMCMAGMARQEAGEREEAGALFLRAWNESGGDFERFLSAHCLARVQSDQAERLGWLERALELAQKVNADSAFPGLFAELAAGYEELGEADKAREYRKLGASCGGQPTDPGPFYHGTKADLRPGDLLSVGGVSNYQSGLRMRHIYFTALVPGAALAAALARGDGRERVYVVEPTGPFEHDPNVTDKKFPGNVTRSYRSEAPLKVVGEVEDWPRLTPEQLRKWREKVAANQGEILD